ncbi:unnamed protein product [Rhodiola kirilowii]
MMAASNSATAFVVTCLIIFIASTTSSPLCHVQPHPWLNTLQSFCPLYYHFPPNSPLQVDGDFFDQTVAKLGSGHIAVLFYATWCPFSREALPIYEALSFMFLEINHLTVEQSSVMPSVLSSYGIHSFPAILIVNQSSNVRYNGPRDLSSLIQHYKKTTGAEPVQYMTSDHLMSLTTRERSDTLISSDSSLKEMLSREPCLIFSILFVMLRLLHLILPRALACAKAVWLRFIIPQMNLEIYGGTSQILGRALNIIDVKRFWTKLKLCKNNNFHQRARSARVWASSLASVSVGDN